MKKTILSLMCLMAWTTVSAKVYTVTSPNGVLTVKVSTDQQLRWNISKDTTTVLRPSAIGLTTDQMHFGPNVKVKKSRSSHVRKASGDYSLLQLICQGATVEFRVFNDAAAYRITPAKPIAKVVSETSEYRFADNYQAFVPYVNDNRGGERWCYSFESYYDEQRLSQLYADSLAITPLAVCLPQGKKAVVMEANVENYPGMYLVKGEGNSLEACFPPLPLEEVIGGHARLNLVPTKRADHIAEQVSQLPWRVVLVTDADRELLGNNIAQRLGPSCRMADTSWIKPGKVAWDWWNNTNLTGVNFRAGINTDTYKYYIDFAHSNHLEYIIIDEGWSDPEDLMVFSDKMDMAGIIDYAKSKDVGVILWSSWRNLVQRGTAKMDEIMSHYAALGVKGFKVDFFDRDDQTAINSVYDVAAHAALHHLLLDLHGMRPFGVQMAFPNIVNFEGVKGLENSKWEPRTANGPLHDQPRYDVTIPYLRALPGPFDYTPGAMVNAVRSQFFGNNDHPMSQGTRVHQMAMYTLFDAPLQMLADSPSKYMQNQECTDFIADIPTVFDETRAIDGILGEYAVVAKRKGSTWYVAAMNNWTSRDINLSLSFLGEGKHKAIIFADGVNADREATDYRHTEQQVDRTTSIPIHLAPAGGWTAIIR